VTPPDTVPWVAEADLRDVSDAKDEALRQWEARLTALHEAYQTHNQRLRPVQTHMEERLLRAFAGLINQLRQQDLGIETYIWRSRDDAKVRDRHAANDDRLFRWDTPPEGGRPGQAYNCRCTAEPVAPGSQSGVILADFAPAANRFPGRRLRATHGPLPGRAHSASFRAARLCSGLPTIRWSGARWRRARSATGMSRCLNGCLPTWLDPDVTVTETACCACGAPECRFVLHLP
jgi:SPP1 gp7 family putative phage head morphogenesis protein